jgi:sucrose-6F-phosphate phosphohydrolase
MLLATDLDGTFLGGSEQDRLSLYRLIATHEQIRLVFVTGRGIDNIVPLLEKRIVPRPEYIICDVGGTILHGDTLQPVTAVQKNIAAIWAGEACILEGMKGMHGLRYQEVRQQHRCSFIYDETTDVAAVKTIAASLDCDVIQSHGQYLDIMPKGVNKGTTLVQLMQLIDYPADNVLVAGDTMNDSSLYDPGYKGVVVGGAELELLQYTADKAHVLQASIAGAGGIMEAMQHFSEFGSYIAGKK